MDTSYSIYRVEDANGDEIILSLDEYEAYAAFRSTPGAERVIELVVMEIHREVVMTR